MASFGATGFGTSVTVVTDRCCPDHRWLERWIAKQEAVLSRFDPDSELSQLNARAGRWVEVSPLLWGVLEAALAVARATGGLVTPTVLNALVRVGYDRPFGLGLNGGPVTDHPRESVPSAECVELDAARRAVRCPDHVRLDLGGFAKGYLAEALADELGAPTLVELGGDIAARGPRADGTAWALETDRAPESVARLLVIERGGVATSGTDRRRWVRDGATQHHLIDPRTGLAAHTDIQRVTVIAPTAILAEAAAKLSILLGLAAAARFVDARPELAALFVTSDGREWPSARLEHFLFEEHGQAC